MSDGSHDLAARLAALPSEWPDNLLPEIRRRLAARPQTVVVLDDDPTGTQTVSDIPVLTEWTADSIARELAAGWPALYLLTNSRSMLPERAHTLAASIGRDLSAASAIAGRAIAVVSRSDSTLRGHFPGEVAALAEGLGGGEDAWLVAPFFLEGGRYTIGDTHYVAQGQRLIPAGATEFARDPAFGYRESNLRAWVAEKTGGRVRAEDVAAIAIEDLRRGGPERVAELLLALRPGAVCIVNAASYRDMQVLVVGLLAAEAAGRRYLYRTAASFVRARAGLVARPLLTRADLDLPPVGGGLVVAGSFVLTTTAQLAGLRAAGVESVEVDVAALVGAETRARAIADAAGRADAALRDGRDVALFTSRELIGGDGAAGSLAIGRSVSDGLCAIVGAIATRPRYMVAKGGITSSDLATIGLGVRRAIVLGQILPGVPVWQLGEESRHPGLRYIVFPGNVGGPGALADVVAALRA